MTISSALNRIREPFKFFQVPHALLKAAIVKSLRRRELVMLASAGTTFSAKGARGMEGREKCRGVPRLVELGDARFV